MKHRLVVICLSVVVGLSTLLGASPGAAAAVSPTRTPTKAPTQQPTPRPTTPSTTTTTSANSANLNPLTGLPVEDSSLLELPPALVSISNFPVSARPQTGLSTSPLVFEMYIGEGMTRFLALFYGDYAQGQTTAAEEAAAAPEIGPIRSGRLPYEDIRTLYDGFIVMSGAYISVAQQLSAASRIYNDNPDDINGTGVTMTSLETLAEEYKALDPNPPSVQGMKFDSAVPAGGEDANRLWVFYNYYNQVEWTYDAASGKYLRAQDKADGTGVFYPATDKLTGEQLGFENVVVLFAPHEFKAPTLVDIDLLYLKNYPALLFRDGQVYHVKWSSRAPLQPLQFVDDQGNTIAYKPGHTFFEVVSMVTSTSETAPGSWKVRFYNPK